MESIDLCFINASDNWKAVVDDLDKYLDGEEIEYTVKEVPIENYTTSVDGLMITNTVINPPEITPPNTSIEGLVEYSNDVVSAIIMVLMAMLTGVGLKRVFE